MHDLLPDGDDLRRAIRWISDHLQENPDRPTRPLVMEAIFKFNISPKDSDFLLEFYPNKKVDAESEAK